MNELNNIDTALNTRLGDRDGYIYNITTQVTWQVHEAWLAWLLDEYVPAILGTGCFTKHQVVRLLETDETDGPVYAVQYYAAGKAFYDNYVNQYRADFAQLEQERWSGTTFSFSSLMQVVN